MQQESANEHRIIGLRVRAITDAGAPLSITGRAAATAYADVRAGEGSLGRIVIDLPNGESVEHAVAIAGDPDRGMCSVGPIIDGPMSLAQGKAHVRLITLRDANGTPVSGAGNVITVRDTTKEKNNLGFAFGATVAAAKEAAEAATEADIPPSVLADGAVSNVAGVYPLGIRALTDVDGLYSFEVEIRKLDGTTTVIQQSTDVDGNPLEALVGSEIESLSVTSESEPEPAPRTPTRADPKAEVLSMRQELADKRARRERLRLRNQIGRLKLQQRKVDRECDRLNEEGLALARALLDDEACTG